MALDIVLTNDDGYDAPGITTLYEALVAAGHTVTIVAPEANQSAQGSSLGGIEALTAPINITEYEPGKYFVDGRPAVATLTALDYLFPDDRPDLVISGTNRGDNAGASANISGTVNAAVAAIHEGVPAIAVSAGSDEGDYTTGFANAARYTVDVVAKLEEARAEDAPLLPDGSGLSINVPGVEPDGVALTTIDRESNGNYPVSEVEPGVYGSTFVPAEGSSGNAVSEGAQLIEDRITVSAIDGAGPHPRPTGRRSRRASATRWPSRPRPAPRSTSCWSTTTAWTRPASTRCAARCRRPATT